MKSTYDIILWGNEMSISREGFQRFGFFSLMYLLASNVPLSLVQTLNNLHCGSTATTRIHMLPLKKSADESTDAGTATSVFLLTKGTSRSGKTQPILIYIGISMSIFVIIIMILLWWNSCSLGLRCFTEFGVCPFGECPMGKLIFDWACVVCPSPNGSLFRRPFNVNGNTAQGKALYAKDKAICAAWEFSGVSSVCVVVHGALNLPCWPSLRADWARHVQQIWLSCHRIRFAGVRDLQLQKLKGASALVDWTNMHLHFLT